MKWHSKCRYMELPREYSAQDLARFHGHLGPYIVLGYRIGRYACENLSKNPFSLSARVYCSGTTPESCLADGVQLGSGCTLGKGNIRVVLSDEVKCEFTTEGRHLMVTPKPFSLPEESDDYELLIERYSEEMYRMDSAELFDVREL